MKSNNVQDTAPSNCNTGESICLSNSNFKRLVIIGGGFAGLELIKGLKNKDIQVVLIDRNNFHQFQPLLYQVATSGLEPDSIVFPLRKQLKGYKNVQFRYANVEQIDTQQNIIYTNKGSLTYNYLVIATGTATNFFEMPHIQKYSLGLKNIRDALNIRHLMLQNLEQAATTCDQEQRDALTNFVIVGGGPAGVEMAGALAEFCNYILPKDYPEYPASIMKIYLIEASPKILSSMSEKASQKTLEYLKRLNVIVRLNERVTDYNGYKVSLSNNQFILAKNLIWTAGVIGQFPKGIHKNAIFNGNRIKTDAYLKVIGYKNIYAMGDIAAVISKEYPNGHPQVAQPAMQQGRFLAKHFVNLISKKSLKQFVYKDKGSLATVGKKRAVADIGKLKLTGFLAWLIWSFVHLMSISGFRNKILVGLNWAISYFSYEKSNRLIIRNYKKPAINE